jgi:hypothetical protein
VEICVVISAHPHQTWVFVGDSITFFGWYGPLVAAINAAIAALPNRFFPGINIGARAQSTGVAQARNTSVPGQPINAINSGVVGNKVADIATDVTNRILQYNPDVVVYEVGINDVIQGTNTTAFTNSYASMVAQVAAGAPLAQQMALSCFCYGEQWRAPGDHWGVNVFDPNIADVDARIAAAILGVAGTSCDVRTPLGVGESINNIPGPPGAVNGVYTSDAIHPLANGQSLMSAAAFALCSVTP